MALGTDICPGTVIISIVKYPQKIIDKFSEVLRGKKACPAGDTLFKTLGDTDRDLWDEDMTKQFHRTMSRLLFLCKQTRQDVKTLVSFLPTRVK